MTSISSYYGNAYVRAAKPVVQPQAAASTPATSDSSTTPAGTPPNAATKPLSPVIIDLDARATLDTGYQRPNSATGMAYTSINPATKPFAQVALDARAALDAGYERLGEKADDETTGDQWIEVGLENFDRRTLYAMASNEEGLFSQVEMSAAQSFMTRQQGEAMMAADPTRTDFAARFKAGIDFLDNVSEEEKSSMRWAQERAAAQTSYEMRMRDEGRVAENVDSGNLVVRLFVKAYSELVATNDPSQDVRNMPSWLKATELWGLQNDTDQQIISWSL